jgi:hypothetical protein
MQTPALPGPDDRGKRWLQAPVHQILAEAAVPLAPPHAEGDLSSYWGTDPDTVAMLYLRLEGDQEPKTLHFRRNMIAGCGSGLYSTQHRAVLLIPYSQNIRTRLSTDCWSCTSSLRIIRSAQKPGKIPSFHDHGRGCYHGITRIFLPTGVDRTRLGVPHAV